MSTSLTCSDCSDFLQTLKDQSVDLIVADPPYGMGVADWDHLNMDEVRSWLGHFHRVLKPTGSFYWFGSPNLIPDYWLLFREQFYENLRWLTWYYRNASNINHNTWGWNTQAIIYGHLGNPVFNLDDVRIPYSDNTNTKRKKHDDTTSRFGISKNGKSTERKRYHENGRKPTDLFEIPTVTAGVAQREGYGHPTQKPEALIEKLILASSNEGDFVVDPFLGSGTSAVVASKLKRHFAGCDRDLHWVATTQQRLIDNELTFQVME